MPSLGSSAISSRAWCGSSAASIPASIADLAEGWRLNRRRNSILRAILRAGTYEMLHAPGRAPRVVITEYLDLAHAFFAGKEPRWSTAMLDKLGRGAPGGVRAHGSTDG